MFVISKEILYIKIVWKNTVEPDRPQMTIWRMHIECWITMVKNTNSEHVILIGFPLKQWLHESVSVLSVCSLPVLFIRS